LLLIVVQFSYDNVTISQAATQSDWKIIVLIRHLALSCNTYIIYCSPDFLAQFRVSFCDSQSELLFQSE